MELPTWIHNPVDSVKQRIPTRRQIEDRTLGTRKGRMVAVGAVYAVLLSVYLSGQIPYPAVGEEGWIVYYDMTSTQRGALAWGMIAAVVSYPIAKRIIALVYSPDENVLREIDPAGNVEETWVLGDERLAEMDVIGGELATRRTLKGKVWICIGYDPEENVAMASWEGTVDARTAQTLTQRLNRCISDTQDRAREADKMERNFPEIIRRSVAHEMKEWVDQMDEADPIVSGDGWREARRDILDREIEESSTERDAETRKQRDEKDRKDVGNGHSDVEEVEAFGGPASRGSSTGSSSSESSSEGSE